MREKNAMVYLGWLLSADGRIGSEVSLRIGGCHCRPLFYAAQGEHEEGLRTAEPSTTSPASFGEYQSERTATQLQCKFSDRFTGHHAAWLSCHQAAAGCHLAAKESLPSSSITTNAATSCGRLPPPSGAAVVAANGAAAAHPTVRGSLLKSGPSSQHATVSTQRSAGSPSSTFVSPRGGSSNRLADSAYMAAKATRQVHRRKYTYLAAALVSLRLESLALIELLAPSKPAWQKAVKTYSASLEKKRSAGCSVI